MECKASGVLDTTTDESALTSLQDRLCCISGEQLVPLKQLQIVIQGPSYTPNSKGAELHLVQQLQELDTNKHGKPSSSWTVRHEGMPVRGKGAADLPATVRAVTESSCTGGDVIGFWTALGFQRRYSMVKQGFSVSCYLDNHSVRVTVSEVCKEGSGGAAGEQVAPGFWLVEATAMAAEGQHASAAAAIGKLAELLEPLVLLQKQ